MTRTQQTSQYSFREELAHGISHGIGTGLAIAGLVFLLIEAIRYGENRHVTSAAIYGSSLILLYLASTLYHLIPTPGIKRIFQKLDHAMIYVLIAGTYTPLTLVTLRGAWGWTLFCLVWGSAICGMVLEMVLPRRIGWLSISLYLGMGWVIVIAGKPLLASLATGGIILLVTGGLLYSLGVIFYAWKKLSYHHAVWHLFVLAGSTAHFFAILLYVYAPSP
ncbi:MAG: hemolysin III family protein [Proteobacteria bacterium]|nr:hemolysin III family protein [Pseudomonadota bacterium]